MQKHADNPFSYHLVYTENRLELQHNPHLHKYKHRPVFVDFLNSKSITRRIRTSYIKDPLSRAVGIKSGFRPYIIDTTAGLGLDGFTLAWLGCKVMLIERSVVIHALLQDGIFRASEDPMLKKIINTNITLKSGNSIHILNELKDHPDTILLDPMYPQNNKRPLNKKEMRVLRDVVGDDNDSPDLFTKSLGYARKRVVVKRPKGAESIIKTPAPTHNISMKSGRFDVYLINQL